MGKIKRILDNEWTKIFVEKLLLAGAIVGMTFFFDNVLKREKIRNTVRQTSVNKFIDACNSVWNEIYLYESAVRDVESDMYIYALQAEKPTIYDFKFDSEFSSKYKSLQASINRVNDVICYNKFILGKDLTRQFYIYREYVTMRLDASFEKICAYSDDKNQNAVEVYETFSHELSKLRFDLQSGQEYAINFFLDK